MLPEVSVGEPVSRRSAVGISAVYACCRVLTDSALLCPLRIYRRLADGSRQQVESGKLYDLWQRPAPAVTGPALTARLVQSLAINGEAIIGKVRDQGQIVSLEAIDPWRVTVSIKAGQPLYRYSAPDGTQFENLTTSDIVHVVGVVDGTGIRGLSPIASCREAFSLASALSTSANATWQNQATPSGLLRVAAGPAANMATILALKFDGVAAVSPTSAWLHRPQPSI